jgi:hypothetical protein
MDWINVTQDIKLIMSSSKKDNSVPGFIKGLKVHDEMNC